MRSFRSHLYEKDFVVTFELVPGRSTRTRRYRDIIGFAEKVAEDGLFDALSITDNAGGHPALAPEALGRELKRMGHEPIIHFSCKDKNRNKIESDLLALDREGLHNLLILTGDYPRYGYRGRAKPVFDLDSVSLLRLISEMEKGFRLPPEVPGGGITLPPIPFFAGCVVNPFKWSEAETVTQYYKLIRKLRAGARFVITQVGFSARKFQEVKFFLEEEGFGEVPILGSILVMDVRLARLLYRGAVPGITVTERLLKTVEAEARRPDKGREAALLRAAKLMALLKGLGFQGAHICGAPLDLVAARELLAMAEEFYPSWKEFLPEFSEAPERSFFLYDRDPETGLNLRRRRDLSPRSVRSLTFLFSGLIHRLFFSSKAPFFRLTKSFFEKLSGSRFEKYLARLEYGFKKLLFDCQECGDCMLGELAFLCPQSQCAKYLLNGPCGGSQDGWCEVYPGKRRCVYVRIYERLSPEERRKKLLENEIPPRNWALYRTSSWLNFYMGKDHHSLLTHRKS